MSRRSGRTVTVRSARGAAARDFDWLERFEIVPAIEAAIRRGEPVLAIARRLGVCDRTVFRHKRRLAEQTLLNAGGSDD